MTIETFANDLAAVTFTGVTTVFAGIPKELTAAQLPAKYVLMPAAEIEPNDEGRLGTFAESASRYEATLKIAVSPYEEGLPDAQRTAVIQMAARVEAWAKTQPQYRARVDTAPAIEVGMRAYRGVTATIEAPELD